MNTIDFYNERKQRIIKFMEKIRDHIVVGKDFGVTFDDSVLQKLNNAISGIQDRKLSIALIGGFSEGKTTIAAAWAENYDSSMQISQSESTDKVNVYNFDEGYKLIDTPGLFGFKENENKEKYKDITKKYVSEADIILYVVNPDNPIKQSQKEDLIWLFKDLKLLDRTVFVLSHFDEVADLEDEEDYEDALEIKVETILERLRDFDILKDNEIVPIVAVSANPYGKGIKYWLDNLDEYKMISHIPQLQKETTKLIENSGGKNELMLTTQQSIIKDVLLNMVPTTEDKISIVLKEITKLSDLCTDTEKDIDDLDDKIIKIKSKLKKFVVNLFSDLIIKANGTTLDTIDTFFEKNIGENGIVLQVKIEEEFEKNIGLISGEISNFKTSFYSGTSHYNNIVGDLALGGLKFGKEYLKNGGVQITNEGVLAVRDVLMPSLKFKPWGAVKLAEKLTKGAAIFGSVLGIGIEVYESYDEQRKKEELNKLKIDLRDKFNQQREELISFLNDPAFVSKFFPDYPLLRQQVNELRNEVNKRENLKNEFEEWKRNGEIIEAEFVEFVEK